MEGVRGIPEMAARNTLLPLSDSTAHANRHYRIVRQIQDAVTGVEDASQSLNGALCDINQQLTPSLHDGSK